MEHTLQTSEQQHHARYWKQTCSCRETDTEPVHARLGFLTSSLASGVISFDSSGKGMKAEADDVSGAR
jgi:hypothetical protein